MTLLRDVAIRHLLTIDPRSTLRRASKVMSERGVGCAVVVENERVAGIVTERDILHALAQDKSVDDTTVDDVMTRDVVSGEPGWQIAQAVQAMSEGGFRHLLVMELNDPVGIVSLRDLMQAMVETAEADDVQPA
jgi:CBS domain-containing protein